MEGDADGSIAMTEAADKFNEEHEKLHHELVMPERTKSVCEVCGVFINSTDNEQRRLVCLSPTAMILQQVENTTRVKNRIELLQESAII